MKIALVYNEILPALRYGGVERVVMNLARELKGLGHSVFLLCKTGSDVTDYEHGFLPDNWESQDLSRLIPSDCDFIHIHQPIKLKPSKPFLITIHGNAQPGEVFFKNTNFVSRSHAENHNAKYYVLQAIATDNLPFTDQKENYFTFLAKAAWRVKNVKTSIEFANDTKTLIKIIGGTGRNSQYVEWLGLLGDHEGRLDILAQSKALVYLTNWQEPCALAPLEAMGCGTPVLGTYNGSMPEEVLSGGGFLVKSYDELIQKSSELSSLNPHRVRDVVLNNFSTRRQARDYVHLYQKILTEGELDHSPRYRFGNTRTQYLFKPTLLNRAYFFLRGKI